MKIPLQKFESVIDARIVERGEEYFYDEAVRGLKSSDNGQWNALVEGTRTYKVQLSIKGTDVVDYSCSCPYDLGPVCKHVVAVLFAVQEKREGNPQRAKGQTSAGKKIVKKRPAQETLEQVIARMPREELNAVLLDYAGREPDFTDHVSARRTLQASSSDKEQYRRIVQNAVDAVRDEDDFIGYRQTSRAVDGAEMVLNKAQEFLAKKKPAKALPIFQIVLEEMVPLVQEADDSDGCIGDVIDQSFQGLSECARQAKDPAFRKELFDCLLREAGHKRYEGWSNWRWKFLMIGGEIVKTPDERDQLFGKIDDIERMHGRSSVLSDYDAERAVVIKLSVIERLGTKQDAEIFIEKHLNRTPIRERAVELAVGRKDYDSAKTLALDGIKPESSRGLLGIISRWKEKLLEIAQIQHDKESVKKYALELFLDINDFEYYARYKECFTAEWPQEAQRIIDLIIKSRDNRNNILLLPEIYIREERWSDLLDVVKRSNSAGALERFSRHLDSRFPSELVEIYEKVIVEQLAPPMGRGSYQYLCRFLRRMQKLGANDRVKILVAKLLQKYSNRPAMLEELRRV